MQEIFFEKEKLANELRAFCSASGVRTRVSAVRGRRPGPLDECTGLSLFDVAKLVNILFRCIFQRDFLRKMFICCHFGMNFFVSPLKGVKRGIKFVCVSFAFKFISFSFYKYINKTFFFFIL